MPNLFNSLINSSTRLYYRTESSFGISETKIRTTEKSTLQEITNDLISSMNFFLEDLSPENMEISSNMLKCLRNAKYSKRRFTETIKTVLPSENEYFNGNLHMWIHLYKNENRIESFISIPNNSNYTLPEYYKVSSTTTIPKELLNSKNNQNKYLMVQEVLRKLEEEYAKL